MISNKTLTTRGLVIWAICALFFLYEFFLRTVIGTFQHPIMYDLELSSFKYSLLSSTVYLIIYSIMQIPVGLIVKFLGLKQSLLIGAIICSISAFGFAYASGYNSAIFFRFLMGFGSAFGFICLVVSVYEWLPEKNSAFFIGLSQFIGTIGPILAAGPLDEVSKMTNISWRTVFLILGCFGAFITVLVAFIVKQNQEKSQHYLILKRPESVKRNISRLFYRSQPWFIALFSACIYFSVEYLSENEGKNFFVLQGLNSTFASYLITIAWFGFAIGCPLLGFISDTLQRRKIIMIISGGMSLISISIIIFIPMNLILILAFFFLGIGTSGQTIGFAAMAEQFKKPFLAIGLSFNNATISAVSALNAPFIGWILDLSNQTIGVSVQSYYIAFSILIAMSAIALILATIFIKETFCKSSVEYTVLNLSQ